MNREEREGGRMALCRKARSGERLGGGLIRRHGTIPEKVKDGVEGQRSGRLFKTMGKQQQADGQS